jgi:hypothetical protein
LAEDGVLELAQLGAGPDSDLLDQRSAGRADRLRGLGLTSGPEEGEHALGVEALVQGVLGDKRLEAPDHLAVASHRERRIDRELGRA